MDASARRKYVAAAASAGGASQLTSLTGRPRLPDRKHAYYNGPVCIGPPDGAKQFNDEGVEECNVVHGPLVLRGPIKLDGAAAVSLFHELYSDREDSGVESIPRGVVEENVSERGFRDAWERLTQLFHSPEKPTEAPSPVGSSRIWAVETRLRLTDGLEWDPFADDGLSWNLDAAPSTREVLLRWSALAKNGADGFQTTGLSHFVEDSQRSEHTALSIRGRVSFATPDPIGHRVLYAVRRSDGSKHVLGVTPAKLSRGASLPQSVDFDAVFPDWTSNDSVEIRLARRPPGKIAPVKTDSFLSASLVQLSK